MYLSCGLFALVDYIFSNNKIITDYIMAFSISATGEKSQHFVDIVVRILPIDVLVFYSNYNHISSYFTT